MKLGDLISIKSAKKKITGLIIGEPTVQTAQWTVILDSCGNIIWWPPDDLVTLNSSVEKETIDDTDWEK